MLLPLPNPPKPTAGSELLVQALLAGDIPNINRRLTLDKYHEARFNLQGLRNFNVATFALLYCPKATVHYLIMDRGISIADTIDLGSVLGDTWKDCFPALACIPILRGDPELLAHTTGTNLLQHVFRPHNPAPEFTEGYTALQRTLTGAKVRTLKPEELDCILTCLELVQDRDAGKGLIQLLLLEEAPTTSLLQHLHHQPRTVALYPKIRDAYARWIEEETTINQGWLTELAKRYLQLQLQAKGNNHAP